MKLFATETEACVIDRATIDSAHQSLPTMLNVHPKQTRNPHGTTLVCSRKGEPARFPQPRPPLPTGTDTTHEPTYRFQEGDETA